MQVKLTYRPNGQLVCEFDKNHVSYNSRLTQQMSHTTAVSHKSCLTQQPSHTTAVSHNSSLTYWHTGIWYETLTYISVAGMQGTTAYANITKHFDYK